MQINIKDCIKNSLQKHVLSLKFVTYQLVNYLTPRVWKGGQIGNAIG